MPAQNPLEALRTLLQGQQPPQQAPFDPVQLRSLQDTRRRELEGQIGMAQRTGDKQDVAGMGTQLESLTNEMDSDPFTGLGPQKQVADIQAADQNAILKGFLGGQPQRTARNTVDYAAGEPSPLYTSSQTASPTQQMAQYTRKQDEFKAGQPERVAKLQAEAGMQLQDSRNTADLYRQNLGAAQQLALQDNYQKFAKDMSQGNSQVSRFQMPTKQGGGSISFSNPSAASQRVPPALSNQLTQAQAAAAQNGSRDWMGNLTPYGVQLQQSQMAVLQAYPIDPAIGDSVKDAVREVLTHPQASQAQSAQEALDAAGFDVSQISPQELSAFEELFMYLNRVQ